jgi:hypothetical protein
MAQGVRIETKAGIWVQTPTRGILPYFWETVLEDYTVYEG